MSGAIPQRDKKWGFSMYYIQYSFKKEPFTVSIYPFDSSFLSILYLLKTTDDDMNYRTVYKNGSMIARQKIYNGVSYER